MDRYVCIHGHFYQPPRENPWLERVELQDSAYPYHDWNERITAECYAPNAVARVLGPDGRIARLVNNYARMSFNFGPTLLAWMQVHASDVYERILEADRESRERFSGHGSALAQVYNHVIMPLADRVDKTTQVVWGIRDFQHRLGRDPEGMWLAETAVDLETLETLAEHGIRFTILAPHQAARVRPVGAKEWQDVGGAKIDPSVAYRQTLPSGRSIALFFYDGPVSRAVAFEQLLRQGDAFVGRLNAAFSDNRKAPQLVHIATDGESYGHHHPHGDMALAFALEQIAATPSVKLTNYGEFLEQCPPQWEVQIVENSSWSCAHGVERWRSACGCNMGRAGWQQNWRGPLRAALDLLRDAIRSPFEKHAADLLIAPWVARDDYIEVVLDRRPDTQDRFLDRHAKKALTPSERVTALKLLEMQRHALLMYTSCAWFFDEISGIESVQVLTYAGRVLQLAEEVFGASFEKAFVDELAKAPSNLPNLHPSGKDVYEKYVRPCRIGWKNMAAHYAVGSLFEPAQQTSTEFGYRIAAKDARMAEAGRVKMVVGHAGLVSDVTREEADFAYAALHLGDHNVNAGITPFPGEGYYLSIAAELTDAFSRVDIPAILRLIDKHFGESTYSLASLFRDLQREVLHRVLRSRIDESLEMYHKVYEQNLPLMRFLRHLDVPVPAVMKTAVEVLTSSDLRWALRDDVPDFDKVRSLVRDSQSWGVKLDTTGLGYHFTKMLDGLAKRLQAAPEALEPLVALTNGIELAHELPFEANFWTAQNVFFDVAAAVYSAKSTAARTGDVTAGQWELAFLAMGEKLGVDVAWLKKSSDRQRTAGEAMGKTSQSTPM